METRGNHHPPYNPWDPPPPPLPPSDFQWGGAGDGGGGFRHYHHHDHFNGPPDHFNGPPDRFNGPPDHFNGPPDHFNGPPDHFNGPPDHFNGPPDHFNGPPDLFNGPPHLFRKRKLDTNPGFAKLYVGPVPRNVCQEKVFHLFEEFGNIIEVVLLTDKKTGLQQEFCFVKYASIEDAERAITALHGQFTFPGAMIPIKVKYADRERRRVGFDHIVQQDSSLSRSGLVQHDSTISGPVPADTEHKVYVNGLNRDASKEEIGEIFSAFGIVADIYIMRDELKRSRGCGFVGFAQRCMAMAAINGLNGTYIMRGCDLPLVVRFADPKKPKNGDFRPTTQSADMRRNNVSNALHLGNSPACTKLSSSGEQAGSNCIVANQPRCPPREMQQMLTGKSFSPLRLSQMSLHVSQTSKSPKACIDVELNTERLSSERGSCALSEIDYSEAFGDCDWSEHICPDGDKYYFNCVTSESSWEKPEEFVLCEQRIQRLKSQDRSCKAPHTSSLEAPNEEDQSEAAQYQKKSRDFEKLQSPVSCAAEHGHELASDEPSSVGGPAFVQ